MKYISSRLRAYLESDFYPIVKLPQIIKELHESVIDISAPIIPEAPPVPIKNKIEKPCLPTRDRSGVFLLFIIGFIVFYSGPSLNSQVISVFGIILLFVGILNYYFEKFKYSIICKKYEYELNKFLIEEKATLEIFNIQMNIYNAKKKFYEDVEIIKYRKTLDSYKKIKTILKYESEDTSSLRKSLLNLYLIDIELPRSLDSNKNLYHGISESWFEEKLTKRFPQRVAKKDSSLVIGDICYTPDFILLCSKTDMIIAIEIDEPYVFNTKKAIHINEIEKSKRDEYFEKSGWVLVRFTERQVIESSYDCIEFIAELANWLQFDYCACSKIASYNIKQEKSWTKDEADKMATARYRETYIPDNLMWKSETTNICIVNND